MDFKQLCALLIGGYDLFPLQYYCAVFRSVSIKWSKPQPDPLQVRTATHRPRGSAPPSSGRWSSASCPTGTRPGTAPAPLPGGLGWRRPGLSSPLGPGGDCTHWTLQTVGGNNVWSLRAEGGCGILLQAQEVIKHNTRGAKHNNIYATICCCFLMWE